ADAIATVPGCGYRFVLPVHVDEAIEPPARPMPPPLSVVVLPLAAAGGLTDGEGRADALTDAIADLLARTPRAHVVSHQAVQDCRREPFVLRQLARTLGVRYALQGRIDAGQGGTAVSV